MIERISYTADGFIDMRALLKRERSPFIFITGARGAGKTWGAIDWAVRCEKQPFILMRRTQVQADFAGAIETSPLAANLKEDEYLEQVKTGVKNIYRIDVKKMTDGDPETVQTCYIVALSTVSSMRGIKLDQCRLLVFDEFIKEPHERPIREEFGAFKNAYETINRNRELTGEPPLRVLALSNALDLANPYYRGFGIVNEIYKLSGEVWRDPVQGVAIYRPESRSFTDKKLKTALYQIRGAAETLGNAWAEMDTSAVRSMSLKGAVPICAIDHVGFYKLHGSLYASMTVNASVPSYTMMDKIDVNAIHDKHQGLINKLFLRDVTFESVDVMLRCKELVERL